MNPNNLVYVVANTVNPKLYVGKTEQGFEHRWGGHVREARHNKEQSYFKNAIRKHGADKFYCAAQMQISEEAAQRFGVSTGDVLNGLEIGLIARLETWKPDKGYNGTMGGDGGKPTSDARAKISAASTGRPVSVETRAKIAATKIGKKRPPGGGGKNDCRKHGP